VSEELDVLLREIDKKKAALNMNPPLAPDVESAYQERFLYDNIYHNNAIEGNQLTREEVELVLKDNQVIPGKSFRDHVAVLGYLDALILAQRYGCDGVRITEHELRKLHRTMLIDQQLVSGEYRNYNLMIHGHRPTSYEKVPYKMTQLVEARPSDLRHPIENIAFFHLRLEKIHPFGDGNGRVGRLIMNALLEEAGYPAVIVRVEDKTRYYEALNAYDGLDGNPQVEPMQLFLAELVCRQLDEQLALYAPKGTEATNGAESAGE
jgi:Fic family protein